MWNSPFSFVILVLTLLTNGFAVSTSQPKITYEDGCLAIESAQDRNITFRIKGYGALQIDGVDLLSVINDRRKHFIPASEVPIGVQIDTTQTQVFGRFGLEKRVQKLENSTRNLDSQRAISIQRRIVRNNGKLRRLENELKADNCKDEPCKNGGTCLNLYAQFRCLCPNNWQGPTCEEDIDECLLFANGTLGCQNGGTCINTPGSYRCQCRTGFSGLHCIDSFNCLTAPPGELCGHGTCVESNTTSGYDCICDQGWDRASVSGVSGAPMPCTADIDECATIPTACASATCINTPGSFTCGACPVGFTGNGFHCTDIDECLVNNGGCSINPRVLCINTEGSYNCGSCPLGWVGDGKFCTKMESNACDGNNLCHPQATCQIISGMAVCNCPRGMVGDGYGAYGCRLAQIKPCDPNPCKNGGTCTVVGNTYACQCPQTSDGLVKYSPVRNCEIEEDPCISSPCMNGGTCVSNMTSYTFTCLCPRALTGTFCTVDRRGCGRVLRSAAGMLKFPNMDSYGRNERCAWKIRTTVNKVLNITFASFDLEDSANCVFDWLQIHDGGSSASQIIGRFCGNKLPKGGNIISTHNEVYLWFRSDNTSSHKGFELNWNTIEPICGGTINAELQGTIRSPGYPATTPPNRECEWVLKAPFGKVINLVFYSVNFGVTNTCNEGYLAIFSGGSNAGELFVKYCNSTLPAPLRSSTHELTIHFETGLTNTGSSFQVHYSVVEGVIGCGGLFTDPKGEFESPLMANRYVESIDCEYYIQQPNYTYIHIHFLEFDLLGRNCDVEAVEIYEGNKAYLARRFCKDSPAPDYNSTSTSLLIRYHSRGVQPSKFRARYELGCGGAFRRQTGSIKSPGYPGNYLKNLNCIYTIEAPVGYAVSLLTLTFQLKGASWQSEIYQSLFSDHHTSTTSECWTDSLTLYDGFLDETNKIGKYCSSRIPVRTMSKLNQMILVFNSKDYGTDKGFSFVYSFAEIKCGGIVKAPKGFIQSPLSTDGVPSVNTGICHWIFVAPEGYGIQLNFDRFDLVGSNNCSESYIEVVNNATLRSEMIGRFCGENYKPSLKINSNIITLTYHTNSISDGFNISYNYFDESSDCGGTYSAPVGVIKSPGSSNMYLPKKDCFWILEAPVGSQIQLTVKKFDIEESNSCLFDFVEIRNGISPNSPLIGAYCGKNIPQQIPSFTNHLYIHFHSDGSFTHGGFEIEWKRLSSICGGVLDSYEGAITSPHYPELVTSAAKCKWQLIVNKGSTIKIHIKQIGASDDVCLENHLRVYDGSIAEYNRLFFNCSATIESDVETSGNEAIVVYTSHLDDIIGGFILNYTINCNQELRQHEGVIESPNFPNPYPNAYDCKWKIFAEKGQTIGIEVSDFGMDPVVQTDCYDYLEIVDIKDNEVLKRQKYCSAKPDPLTSLGEIVELNFHTDFYDKGSGFHLEYKIQGCGDTYSKPFGKIESPNYPYALDANCVWIIKSEIGYSIQLTLNVELNTNDNCSANSLTIGTGPNGMYEVTKYCQSMSKHMITVPGHEVYIRLKTDGMRQSKGFKADYARIRSSCGGKLEALSGTIYSPNFPKGYDNNLYCEWLLDLRKLHFQFTTLDLEPNCTNDYVAFYITRVNFTDLLLEKVCGSTLTNYTEYIADGFQMKIVFKTNEITTGKGFALQYQEECFRFIVAGTDIGVISKSLSQKSCTYSLRNINPGTKAVLTVTEANCDESASVNPKDSYFTINMTSGPLTFCHDHPPPIFFDDSDLEITLPSGTFTATYTTLANFCGGNFSSLQGKIASPFYPNSYPERTECIWNISCRPGNSLELNFRDMNIPKSEHCNEDYLEIREINSTGKLLGLYCQDVLPASTIVSYDSIWMKFRSDESSVGRGFLAEYNYAYYTELNGTKGRIQSPPPGHNDIVYKWRISAMLGNVIYLYVREYMQGLQLFDGFDETAMELTLDIDTSEITSSTSVLFIVSSRGELKPFVFDWEAVPRKPRNGTNYNICGQETISFPIGTYNVSSPGFPFGYAPNLDCEWILSTVDDAHVMLIFDEIDLDNTPNCLGDYIEVSTSVDLKTWENVERRCTLSSPHSSLNIVHGTPYLKVNFHTDFYSNGTGFRARVKAACGGVMTKPQGEIRSENIFSDIGVRNCSWKIQVRPGRKIQFSLIINRNVVLPVTRYINIRNGIDEHSPPLGPGRFLMTGNNVSVIPTTSSNRAFVSLSLNLHVWLFHWTLTYKEVSEQCGDDIVLTNDNDTVTIMTPNYPNIPNPFSDCTWVVRVPSTEAVNVTFIGRFDLSAKNNCQEEYLEVFDGATSMSNLIGVYCNNPKTVVSTGNFIRLHYVTTIADPRNGFSALIGIKKCGGTYIGFAGQITSLNYPNVGAYPTNTVCEYRIKLHEAYRVNLTLNDIDFPYSENSTENDYLAFYPVTNNVAELRNELARINGNSHVATMTFNANEILMKFITFGVNIKHRGFKITYRSMYGRCGATHTGESGEILFPHSQSRQRIKTCIWRIMAPKGQQVKVEVQSLTATGNFSLQFYNDYRSYSLIISVTRNQTDPIVSTGNVMLVKLYTTSEVSFKLKYTSGSVSPCSLAHDEDTKTITSLPLRSYFCEYDFKLSGRETFAALVSMQSAGENRGNCFQRASVIFLMNTWLRVRNICGMKTSEVVSLPFINLAIHTRKLPSANVSFSLTYKRHNCGGVNSEFKNGIVMTKPTFDENYGQLDCAWQLQTKTGQMNNVTIKNNFTEDCDKEFVNIYADFFGNILIKSICRGEPSYDYMFRRSFFVTYHAQNFNPKTNFTIELVSSSTSCGGFISTFPSLVKLNQEDYKNNVECIWDLKALNGFHLEVEFVDRFFLEQSVNCSKDYVDILDVSVENGIATSKGRFCGRTLPKKISSLGNQVQVLFRTDDTNTGDGFSFKVDAVCGGVFNVTERVQTITSPNYPTSYLPNLNCNYTLLAPKNQLIHLTLKAVNLEYAPTCNMDSLTVHEFNTITHSLQPTKTYCRIQHPVEIRSEREILLNFKTDRYIEYEGFSLEYHLETCGGAIAETTYIQTPRDKGNKYPTNMECIWNITAPANKVTAINFKYFEMEAAMDCMSDYLEIYSIVNGKKAEQKRLCGKLTGRVTVIKSKQVNTTIRARSDAFGGESGFAAQISFIDDCDTREFIVETNSSIINQIGSERDIIQCHKSFHAPEGYQIQIEFDRFDLKFCANCSCDYAEIHDGDYHAEIIGKYCGNTVPGIVVSTHNNMTLSYNFGSMEGNHRIRARVKAVKSLCDNREFNLESNITKPIIIKSPDINGFYPPNVLCSWTFKVNYYSIRIHFDKFDLQSSGGVSNECKDYLEIIDAIAPYGNSPNNFNDQLLQGISPFYENFGISKRHRFCGNETPSDYFGRFSPLVVRFKTDSTIQHRGFQISISEAKACHENYTSIAARIVGSTVDCEVFIVAPEGHTISIHFFGYYQAPGAQISIYDGKTNAPINATLSEPIFPNTNEIRMEIKAETIFYYDLSYWATNTGLGCGGKFYGVQGYLSSPLYPSSPQNATTCRWDIQTAKNSRITFKFYDFDMGAKINCNSDYVQLIDYNEQGEAEVATQYCGGDTPAVFKSKTDRMAVVYNKSVHFDGIGWKADFSTL